MDNDACSSSTITSSNFVESYEYGEWSRLRQTCDELKTHENLLMNYSNDLESAVSSDYCDYASRIQNRQIQLNFLRNVVHTSRKMVRRAHFLLGVKSQNLESKEKEQNELDAEISTKHDEIAEKFQTVKELRVRLKNVKNDLMLRQSHMLSILRTIFFPNESVETPTFKKCCVCQKFDLIRGLHLPSVVARLGHSDMEVSSSAGILVLLIDCIRRVISIPVQPGIHFSSSRSYLINHATNEIAHPLYNLPKQPDQFDISLYMLNELIERLRSDCSLNMKDRDRPIQNVLELLLHLIDQNKSLDSSPNSKKPTGIRPPHNNELTSKQESGLLTSPYIKGLLNLSSLRLSSQYQ